MKKYISMLIVSLIVICGYFFATTTSGSEPRTNASFDVTNKDFYANGNEIIIISNGGKTEIYYDTDKNGAYQESIDTPVSEGMDFSNYYIYGGGQYTSYTSSKITVISGNLNAIYSGGKFEGSNINETNLTIKNGTVNSIYGGGAYSDVTGSATIVVNGGTINGNVYGGGYGTTSSVATSNVTITSGRINGTIFGGSELGNVNDTNVSLLGGSLNGSIFGGGNQASSTSMHTNIQFDTGATFSSNIFGGGNSGIVTGNTNVQISSGTLTGLVFGGGNLSTASVQGTASVTLTGGVVSQNIYGGGNNATSNNSSVTITGTGKVQNVYAGGYQQTAKILENTYLNVSETGNIPGVAYGGSSRAQIIGNTYIDITGGTIGTLRGGGSSYDAQPLGGDATVTDIEINMTGGTINTFYGGGNMPAAVVNGNIDISITENAKITGYFYGGGFNAPVKGNVNVEIDGATMGAYVYGGGYNATVGGNTNVTLSNVTISQAAYAGGNLSGATVNGNSTITVNAGSVIRLLYGGGTSAAVLGDATININGGTINGITHGAGKDASVKNSFIYMTGGIANDNIHGRSSKLEFGSSYVEISGGTVNADVYGGGAFEDAETMDEAHVVISGDAKINGSVVGGNLHSYASKSSVTVEGGIVYGNIYGAGLNGNQTTSFVSITNGTIYGNVYGGGKEGNIDNTEVSLSGGIIAGNVYGASYSGDTVNSKLTILSGNFAENNAMYAAGFDSNTHVENSTLEINGGSTPDIIFAGGHYGKTGDTKIIMNGDATVKSIYAGGHLAQATTTNNTEVQINSGNIIENIYGGGGSAKVDGDSQITISGGTINNVYGGGSSAGGSGADITNTNIIIEGGTITGNVYAGANSNVSGKVATVLGSTSLTITEGKIEGNVYGGGRQADVIGSSTINIQGGIILGNVNGAGETGNVNGEKSLIIGHDAVIGSGTTTSVTTGVILDSLTKRTFSIDNDLTNKSSVYVIVPTGYEASTVIATDAVKSDARYVIVLLDELEATFKEESNEIILDYKSASVSGKVTNNDGDAIANATVELSVAGTSFTTTTDANGFYSFELGANFADYKLSAYALGYDLSYKNISLEQYEDLYDQDLVLSTLIPVTSITLDSIVMYKNNEVDVMELSILEPTNATYTDIVWSIETNSIGATITPQGDFLSTGTGEVKIIATVEHGSGINIPFTAEFDVTVLEYIPVIDILMQNDTHTYTGFEIELDTQLAPINPTFNEIVWTLADGSSTIASLNGNTLTAISAGEVEVIATINNGTAIGTPFTKRFTITIEDFIPVTDITLQEDEVYINNELDLIGEVSPMNASFKTIQWSVVDSGVTDATIIGNKLYSTLPGEVEVKATITNGENYGVAFEKTFTVNVLHFEPVTNIEMVNTKSIFNGETVELEGDVQPNDATFKDIKWSINDDGGTSASIVNGVLSANRAGVITVQATIENGTLIGVDYTQSYQVVVKQHIPVTDIIMTNNLSVYEGYNLSLEGYAIPLNASFRDIEWSLKDTDNASINGNTLSAHKAGEVTVIATIKNGESIGDNFTKEFKITINEFVEVEDYKLKENNVYEGFKLPLEGVINPLDATKQDVAFEITDLGGTDAVIKNGELFSTKSGEVTIKVTIKDGLGNGLDFTKEIIVYVNQFIPVTEIEMLNDRRVLENTSLTLLWNVLPNDATFQDIKWTIIDDGGTNAKLKDGILTSSHEGIVVLRATIVDGLGDSVDFTQEFEVEIVDTPKIILGNNQQTVIGETVLLATNIQSTDFEGIIINGVVVDNINYQQSGQSVYIILNQDFLENLGVGRHTIEFVSAFGNVQGTFTLLELPINDDEDKFIIDTTIDNDQGDTSGNQNGNNGSGNDNGGEDGGDNLPGYGKHKNSWSFINMILFIVTVVITILTYLHISKNYDKRITVEKRKSRLYHTSNMIPVVASLILALLTQRLNGQMVQIDNWTILFIIITITEIIVCFYITRIKNHTN